MLRKLALLPPLLFIAASSADHTARYNKAGELIIPSDIANGCF